MQAVKLRCDRRAWIIGLLCMAWIGCGERSDESQLRSSTDALPHSESASEYAAKPSTGPGGLRSQINVRRESSFPALHNLLKVTESIYSGGEPDGDQAFACLVDLGVKTIVSVDGARPDVERARKYGIRYVHIPIGYDGISADAGAKLACVVREVDGPIYFHCHHGQHRGPAAAAIACIAAGMCDGKQAVTILEAAGTGKDYSGLWRDVEAYRPPMDGADLPELVAVAKVPSVAAAMAMLDRSFDNLKRCRDAEWSMPRGHPDLAPIHEALMVREGFLEASRNLPAGHDDQFKDLITQAIATTQSLEEALANSDRATADHQFRLLEKRCKECHATYRNGR